MDGNGLYSTRSRGGDLVGTEVCPSDCQQPINVILNKIEWPSLAAELDEIKLLSTRLHDSVFTFIPRNLNFRADSLAKGSRSRVECFPNRNLRKKERKMEKKQRSEISSTEAVLLGALAPGVNAPTWNALRFAFLLLGLCLTFMLSIAFTSGQSMLLFHVGFLIVIASSLFVLLNCLKCSVSWGLMSTYASRFLAQTGLVPVETQMQELNLAPTTDKSN
uniref:RNase H type-1 domain-containing protein n=1 Tax=Brassica oleracea var. oleracea TaxID=109376 RepID=A0A0D3CE75_BRAOL